MAHDMLLAQLPELLRRALCSQTLPAGRLQIMSANHHPSEVTEPIGNFDINKIAEHLSVHRSTVERLLHDGEFGKDWWRIGRKIVVPKENVFAYERREREKRA